MWEIIKNEFKLLKGQHLLSLLILVTILRKTLFNRARDMDAYSSVDANNSIAILATIIMGVIVLRNLSKIKKEVTACRTFVYYYVFAGFSVLWAGFNLLPIIGYKAVEVIVSFMATLIIMKNLHNNFSRFLFVLISFSICNTIYLIMFLKTGIGHDNAFPLLAITEFLLIIGAIKYELADMKYMRHHLFISVATIILGTSSASWISLIIGLFFFFSITKKGLNLFAAAFAACLFYGMWSFFEADIMKIVFGNKTKEMIETGSGREALWIAYIKGWSESPIIGHGFIVGEKGSIAAKYIAFATNTAHNMMISVLINTGLIGMMLWISFLYRQCIICWRYSLKHNPYALVCMPAIIAMFVNANSFPVIGSEWSPVSNPIYALLIFIFVYIPYSQHIRIRKSV